MMTVDPSLIVERVLRYDERTQIQARAPRGADVADFLDRAHNADAWLDLREPFAASIAGEALAGRIRWAFPEVGDRIQRLVSYAVLTAAGLTRGRGREDILYFREKARDLAWRTVAYAAGQEDARVGATTDVTETDEAKQG